MSHNIRPAQLTLTPHHLFYLLSRLEELDISIGPMNVRLESIHNETSPSNYVSFLQAQSAPARGRTDRDSLHSVSSVRSVMSGMSAFWSTLGFGHSSVSKSEKAKAATEADLKYLYSAFTKLPSLRLSRDHRARLIKGYEEFPFDTAVPLFAFKNVQQLDIVDIDFRQFYGWDRLAEQLTLLTIKRAHLDDPADLITNIVLDDAEKRRRRSTKGARGSPEGPWTVPSTPRAGFMRSNSEPSSPFNTSPQNEPAGAYNEQEETNVQFPVGSISPPRPLNSRPTSSYRHIRSYSSKVKRSGAGSSNSSEHSVVANRSESSSNLPSINLLSPSKWQRLKYLSLADNSLTSISAKSILPLANTLRSLNLSSNLFSEIPDSLAYMTRLSSLDLSNCMIESLHSLAKNPLPAILTIKLRSNRLRSLAGVERLLSLENLNVQDNLLSDPTEAARLTGIPNLRRIWVKHNPFVRRYVDYRVTIFNLFRRTPGYTEDIVIDDYGPSYGERKQLIDRVPEVEGPPGVRSNDELVLPTVLHQEATRSNIPQTVHADGAEPKLPRSELSNGSIDTSITSARRRKGPRRRIVDLSKEDSLTATSRPASMGATPGQTSLDQADPVGTDSAPPPPQLAAGRQDAKFGDTPHSADISVASNGTPLASARGLNLEHWSHGEDYRTKVEALRQEFGNNWISVLSEQGWDGRRDVMENRRVSFSSPMPTMHRANSQAITSGGRTLG